MKQRKKQSLLYIETFGRNKQVTPFQKHLAPRVILDREKSKSIEDMYLTKQKLGQR